MARASQFNRRTLIYTGSIFREQISSFTGRYRKAPRFSHGMRGNDEAATRLKFLIKQIAADHKSEIIELEVMPDHVHLLIEVDPQYGIHRLVKQVKGLTSRNLRQEFAHLKSKLPTLWTNSYFVSTVGGAPLVVIKQYIEKQKDQ